MADLVYTIEECDPATDQVAQTNTETNDIEVAVFAYQTAIRKQPRMAILLRRQALIMRRKRPGKREEK